MVFLWFSYGFPIKTSMNVDLHLPSLVIIVIPIADSASFGVNGLTLTQLAGALFEGVLIRVFLQNYFDFILFYDI